MRVMVLGGTRFIGAAVVEELHAHGHELLVVHRGEHEPAGLPEVDHLHAQRQDLPQLRGPVDDFDPEAVVDNCAYSAADAETALAAVGDDVRLLVLSSMDVYQAYVSGSRPAPSPNRYPLTRRGPGADRPLSLPRGASILRAMRHLREARRRGADYPRRSWATVCRLPMVYGEHDGQRRGAVFMLRRVVWDGPIRIPIGAGTWLSTRAAT